MKPYTRILLSKYIARALSEIDDHIKQCGELVKSAKLSDSANEYFIDQIDDMNECRRELLDMMDE